MVCGPGAAPSRGTAPVHTAGPITPSALALPGDGASSTVRPVERSFTRGRPRLASTAGKLIAAGTLSRKRPSGTVYQRLAEVQRFQGKHEAALGSAQKAAVEAEAAWSARPGDAAVRSALAAASHQLAEVLADGHRAVVEREIGRAHV